MITTPNLTKIPQLKTIWQTCFDDEDAFIDLFFSDCFQPQNSLVWLEKQTPVAMLTMLPCAYVAGERKSKGHYLYGLATLSEHRGRGIMGALIQTALKKAKGERQSFSILVPADDQLLPYYKKHGYHLPVNIHVIRLSRNDLMKQSGLLTGCKKIDISADQLQSLRANLFKNKGYIQWPDGYIDFYMRQLYANNGRVIAVSDENGATAYAVCEMHKGVCRILEAGGAVFLQKQLNALILQYYTASQFELRNPLAEPNTRFGLYQMLNDQPTLGDFHFGLAMD